MADLLNYSLKLSFCLGAVYLFYMLALRSLTFYSWNRFFLLVATGLCCLIPFMDVSSFFSSEKSYALEVITVFPAFSQVPDTKPVESTSASTFWSGVMVCLPLLFLAGMLLLSVRLIIQFIAFAALRRSAVLWQHGDIKVYQVDKEIAPFSFGRSIFLNKNILQPEELQQIIKHEWVHAHQQHTADIIWMELLCLFNWYNPFAWFLKMAVRQNLEFIADREVLMMPSADKKYYQYLMLKVIGLPDFSIANQFNISSLKSRIVMMNKKPSSRQQLFKFLLVVPLMGVLLVACRDNANSGLTAEELATHNEAIGAEQAPPPPPMIVDQGEDSYAAFLERYPDVKNVYMEPNTDNKEYTVVVVELKTAKPEKYDFRSKADLNRFTSKYEKMPPPPPPAMIEKKQQTSFRPGEPYLPYFSDKRC
jgi:hypothetical protein